MELETVVDINNNSAINNVDDDAPKAKETTAVRRYFEKKDVIPKPNDDNKVKKYIEVPEFENFDPQKDDYESVLNTYGYDTNSFHHKKYGYGQNKFYKLKKKQK